MRYECEKRKQARAAITNRNRERTEPRTERVTTKLVVPRYMKSNTSIYFRDVDR